MPEGYPLIGGNQWWVLESASNPGQTSLWLVRA